MRPQQKLAVQVGVMLLVSAVHIALQRTGVGRYNKEEPSWHDLVHMSLMTSTTIGFGDICPVNLPARVVTWAHALGMVYLLLVV